MRSLNNKGIALVSVIAGAAILAVALTMATSAFYAASRLTADTANLTKASSFAEGVLEKTVSLPFEDIRSTRVEDDLPALKDAACSVEVESREADLKQVTVSFVWSEGERRRQVRFSTLAAKGGS